jgi:entericidin A
LRTKSSPASVEGSIGVGLDLREQFMRKSAVTVLIAAALVLGACNTVKGAGRDIQSVGEAGEEVIND